MDQARASRFGNREKARNMQLPHCDEIYERFGYRRVHRYVMMCHDARALHCRFVQWKTEFASLCHMHGLSAHAVPLDCRYSSYAY